MLSDERLEKERKLCSKGSIVSDLLDEVDRLNAEIAKDRCEHCGSDRIYSGPPDCPRCGAPNCCEMCCGIEFFKIMHDDAQAEIAKLKAAHAWIPVGERLPEDGKLVLFFANNQIVRGRRFDMTHNTNNWLCEGSGCWVGASIVTHWRPLPEPPEQKEGGRDAHAT